MSGESKKNEIKVDEKRKNTFQRSMEMYNVSVARDLSDPLTQSDKEVS